MDAGDDVGVEVVMGNTEPGRDCAGGVRRAMVCYVGVER